MICGSHCRHVCSMHARLDHVQHVGVAVVVVADVLLIQPRQARQLVRRADVLHVPLGDHLLAVGIDRRPQHQDDVVEHRLDLGLVGAADEVVGEQRRVLRSRRLRSNAGRRRCARTPCLRARAGARPRRSGPAGAPAAARSRDSDRSSPGSRAIEISAKYIGRPCDVLPASTSFMYLLAAASFLK